MTHKKKMILLALIVGFFWIGSIGLRIYSEHVLHDIMPDLRARLDAANEVTYHPSRIDGSPEYVLRPDSDEAAIEELTVWLENLQGTKTTPPREREGLWGANIRLSGVICLLKNGGLLMSLDFYEDGTIGVVDLVAETEKYYEPAESGLKDRLAGFFPTVPARARLQYYTDVWHIQDASITCNWASHTYSGQSASTTAVSDFRTWMSKRTVRPSDTPPGNAETDDHYVFKLYGQAGREPDKSRAWEILLFKDGVTVDGNRHYVWADEGSVEQDLEKLLLRFAYGWHPADNLQQ